MRFQVSDVVYKAVNEADDRRSALGVNPVDVSLAEKVHGLAPESEVIEQGRKVRGSRDAGMAVL